MRFHWKDTLRRMTGAETRCPICGVDGLVTWERNERDVLPDLRGIPYCECPRCGARGEFPELVAQASPKGVEEELRDLKATGELEAASRDVETYAARVTLRRDTDDYFSRCVEALRIAPHKGGIRAGMSAANLRQLPPHTGLYLPDGAPPPFAPLQAQRYRQVDMTLYRYAFDGATTCFDAQNPRTLQREHRIRIAGDYGVYLGQYAAGEVPQAVLATHNPRTAGQIYGACRAESSRLPPVVGLAGFPLPPSFADVATLYLLDTPDDPLPLAFALKAYASRLVYGSDRSPRVRVLSPSCPASEVTAADIRVLFNSDTHGKTLADWLSARLLSMSDRLEEVANALLQAGSGDDVRNRLAEMLGKEAPPSLVETVLLPAADPDDVFQLGNGRLVKSTPVGIYAASRIPKTSEVFTRTMLCNVGISVDARIVDRGQETAVCTVSHPDADVPSVQVRIPRQHWNSPEAIAEDIRAAYSTFGRTPYVAFYRSAGYAWADLLQHLGSHCPVQSGIRALGATPEGDVNLPALSVSHGALRPQTKASLLNQNALAAYGGLPATPGDQSGLLDFLAMPATLERTGIAAGLLHLLFCCTGRQFDHSGVRRPSAHLIFVETEPGVWDGVVRALSYILSGSEYVPLLDDADRRSALREWADLGTLPLVARLPSADDMVQAVADSPVPVIGVADPLTALACSGRGTFTFVLPHVESVGCAEMTAEEVDTIRGSVVAVILSRAGTPWLDVSLGGATSAATPALTALGALTDAREPGTVAGGLYRSVRGRYSGAGLTGARAFFGVLHRAWTARGRGDACPIALTVVTGAPDDAVKASFNERGEHVFVMPDKVLVSRSVVQLVNREKEFLFDAEQLSREFAENGILLDGAAEAIGIDGRRVWAFSRKTWDAEVVRAAGFATRKDRT